jgi:hypothetical protein
MAPLFKAFPVKMNVFPADADRVSKPETAAWRAAYPEVMLTAMLRENSGMGVARGSVSVIVTT